MCTCLRVWVYGCGEKERLLERTKGCLRSSRVGKLFITLADVERIKTLDSF